VAHRLLHVRPDAQVTLLEKEDRLAAHQTGRSSGVVHASLYYEPGSLKATLCRRGVGLLKEFCAETGLAYDEVGKVLALDADERQRLDAIAERARANGVPGIRVTGRAELHELEPQTATSSLATSSLAIAEHIGRAHRPSTSSRRSWSARRDDAAPASAREGRGPPPSR
jgi:L-2-hydroxyglutarate oxidase